MKRERNGTGRPSGGAGGTEVSGIQLAQEFSVIEEIEDPRTEGGQGHQEHHPEEDPPVHQRFEEVMKPLVHEAGTACDVEDENVVNDRELPEGLRLSGFRRDDRLVPPLGVAPQGGDHEIPSDDQPHHPGVDETQVDEGKEGGGGENLVGERVEEFPPAGDVAVAAGYPAVVPIGERGDNIDRKCNLVENG